MIYASRLQKFIWYPAGGTSLVAVTVLVVASLALVVLGRGVFDPSQPLDMLVDGKGKGVLAPLLLVANLAGLFLLARGDYLDARACLRAVLVTLALLTLASMALLVALDAGMRAALLSYGEGWGRHVLHSAVLAQGVIFGVLVVSGLVGTSDGTVGRIGERMRTIRSGLEAMDSNGVRLDDSGFRALKEEISALENDFEGIGRLHVPRRDRIDRLRPCLRDWLDLLSTQPRYFVEDGTWRQDRRLVECMDTLKRDLR